MTDTTTTLPTLVADECLDAQGFTTLRPADGSANGDTAAAPVATVYDPEYAGLITRACNHHAEAMENIRDLHALFASGGRVPKDTLDDWTQVLEAFLKKAAT